MADTRPVNFRTIVPIDPGDGSLSHEWPLTTMWHPVELVKDLERHTPPLLNVCDMGAILVPPTSDVQRTTSTYQRGARQINMLQDDPYSQEYDSDSNEEDDVDDNHLQGLSTLIINNIQRNNNCTPRNPDRQQSKASVSIPSRLKILPCLWSLRPSICAM